MTTPTLTLEAITFPGAALGAWGTATLNLSVMTSTTGTVSLLDGDNGSDFCYWDGSFQIGKFNGGARALFSGYAAVGDPAVITNRYQEPTIVSFSPSDSDPSQPISVMTYPFGSGWSVASWGFSSGQVNCGVAANGAPVSRDMNEMLIIGRTTDDPGSTWVATAAFADSSLPSVSRSVPSGSDGTPWAFRVKYSGLTPTNLMFKTERTVGATSGFMQIAWIACIILPTVKRKGSTGIRNMLARTGVFGGPRYA